MDKTTLIPTLIQALNTDGSHHKQHYLEEILRLLTTEEEFQLLQQIYDWEPGIS